MTMWLSTVKCIVTLALSILVVPYGAETQQPAKVHHIGFLRRVEPQAAEFQAFRHGLHALGYREGHNLVIEQRYAHGVPERLPALAAELVQLPVEVIVVDGTLTAQAAKTVTTAIPIIFTLVGDPVGSGLVASLARPGGTLTGLSQMVPELSGKRLELLKEVVPQASRVAALLNPDNPAPTATIPPLRSAAQAVGVQLQVFEVRDPTAFERAFAAMAAWRAEALIQMNDALFVSRRGQLVELTAKARLPTIYEERQFVDAGGLMSYGVSHRDLWQRAATYVDKILKGATPAELPVEQPTKFELVLNLKTAQALGITMPPSLLLLADEVIQ
jgi:ABC-type uncharacterized transport system substrate-binding protein